MSARLATLWAIPATASTALRNFTTRVVKPPSRRSVVKRPISRTEWKMKLNRRWLILPLRSLLSASYEYPTNSSKREYSCHLVEREKVWQRHNLETFKKRLKALEVLSAEHHFILTEEQLAALEKGREEQEAHGEI